MRDQIESRGTHAGLQENHVVRQRQLVFAGAQFFPNVPFVTPGWALWSSLGLAVGTALLFAWIPAQQAADMEPVEALGRK